MDNEVFNLACQEKGTPLFAPHQLVKEAIKRHKENLAISCSFGKDSLVVLHMALKYKPDIKVVFNNTGVEFPETLELMRRLKREWNLNLIETKPWKKSFWNCVDEYGIPTGKSGGGEEHNWPKCCYYLKEMPMIQVCRDEDIRAYLTGITAAESWNRKNLIRMCGQRYFVKKANVFKYHPIAYWDEKKVWAYINKNKIPINKVYKKWGKVYRRVGCMPCTAYKDWADKLSKSHPKLFNILVKKARKSDFYKDHKVLFDSIPEETTEISKAEEKLLSLSSN